MTVQKMAAWTVVTKVVRKAEQLAVRMAAMTDAKDETKVGV